MCFYVNDKFFEGPESPDFPCHSPSTLIPEVMAALWLASWSADQVTQVRALAAVTTLCSLQDTSPSQCSCHSGMQLTRYWRSANLTNRCWVTCDGQVTYPGGGGEIFLVTSCVRNWALAVQASWPECKFS